MNQPEDGPRPPKIPRPQLLLSALLTALAAAVFAVLFFDILAPPLDSSTLLNPPKQRPTSIRPIETVVPPTPQLFLKDDFSSRENWTRADDNGGAAFADKGYLLSPDPAGPYTHVYLDTLTNSKYRDLSLQADASTSPGNLAGYGVFFWHSTDSDGNERFIYFGVTTDGAYTLRAAAPITPTTASPVKSRWVDLISATASPAIQKKSGANRLNVDVHPQRLRAFVNGTLVIDIDSKTVDALRERGDFDGKVGMAAYSLGTPDARVLFTGFDVYVEVSK